MQQPEIPSPFDSSMSLVDVSGLRVMIGIPCGPQLPWQTVQSLVETVVLLKEKDIPFELTMVAGSSIIESARTKVANKFLQSRCNRMFMIDSDVTWEAKSFVKLLALSVHMPVVCGAYPAKMDPCTFLMGPTATKTVTMNEWGCLPIDGMGLGFCVVQRDVIDELARYAPKLTFHDEPAPVAHIFRCDQINGAFRGEDMAFFADVNNAGYKVYLDPTITLGHVGTKVYSGTIMDALKKKV
jgi:hypothetical protein